MSLTTNRKKKQLLSSADRLFGTIEIHCNFINCKSMSNPDGMSTVDHELYCGIDLKPLQIASHLDGTIDKMWHNIMQLISSKFAIT